MIFVQEVPPSVELSQRSTLPTLPVKVRLAAPAIHAEAEGKTPPDDKALTVTAAVVIHPLLLV